MDIISIMEESQQRRIAYTDKSGEKYTGFVDVFESAFDNEDDEGEATICVQRDDGKNVIVGESEIASIKIIE